MASGAQGNLTRAKVHGYRTWELDGARVIAAVQDRTAWLHDRHAHDPRCFYCRRDTSVTVTPSHPLRATVDHYMPLSLRGKDMPRNWRLSCRECNGLKADMHPRDWWDELMNA